jgi:ATP/maltotriose-dependent transcriptional regulator MalT
MLAWIERHNLFLSALDEQGYWFRYHPLLQENLRTMLQQNNDIDRKQLHELASHWFVEQKLWSRRYAMRSAQASRCIALHRTQALSHWRKKGISIP